MPNRFGYKEAMSFGEIRNTQGERIDYAFHEARNGSRDIVVIGHGVTGNKDRPWLVALAEELARSGIDALRISFAGNGDSEGRFEDSTISKEVEDLGAVLDRLDGRAIVYAGHSMGAAVGVLCAKRDPRIKRLVSLAGMVHTQAFAEREFGALKPVEGFMWDKPDCPLGRTYMDDMARIRTVVDHAPEIHVPWLWVHGTADDVVPFQDSKDIFERANEPKQLIELPGADHVFSEAHTPTMVEHVVQWVTEPTR